MVRVRGIRPYKGLSNAKRVAGSIVYNIAELCLIHVRSEQRSKPIVPNEKSTCTRYIQNVHGHPRPNASFVIMNGVVRFVIPLSLAMSARKRLGQKVISRSSPSYREHGQSLE
jgi:hypothetical protein